MWLFHHALTLILKSSFSFVFFQSPNDPGEIYYTLVLDSWIWFMVIAKDLWSSLLYKRFWVSTCTSVFICIKYKMWKTCISTSLGSTMYTCSITNSSCHIWLLLCVCYILVYLVSSKSESNDQIIYSGCTFISDIKSLHKRQTSTEHNWNVLNTN